MSNAGHEIDQRDIDLADEIIAAVDAVAASRLVTTSRLVRALYLALHKSTQQYGLDRAELVERGAAMMFEMAQIDRLRCHVGKPTEVDRADALRETPPEGWAH